MTTAKQDKDAHKSAGEQKDGAAKGAVIKLIARVAVSGKATANEEAQ